MILRWITALIALAIFGACYKEGPVSIPASASPPLAAQPLKVEIFETKHLVEKGSSVYSILTKAGLTPVQIRHLVKTAKQIVSLDRVAEGNSFVFSWKDKEFTQLSKIEFQPSPVRSVFFEPETENAWKVSSVDHPVTMKKVTFAGTVKNSLWDSAAEAGMSISLITALADIFAWQVDFAREVRPGDRWRLTVEQKFVNGEFFAWGNILVAEYVNNGELFTGIRFPQTGEKGSYYFPDGSSLKRMFLKSPLKFARITSKFNRNRFHPIYKRHQPHNGVDYGAPRGTPVMSVGNGVVDFVGRQGAAGKMVRIRHNGTYQTAYCHLNGYAKGVRKGSKVEQGQVVGYVGSTGAATGPHLHFAFFQNGRFVDPLGRKFPSADPVPAKSLNDFKTVVANAMNFLPDWQLAQHQTASAEMHD